MKIGCLTGSRIQEYDFSIYNYLIMFRLPLEFHTLTPEYSSSMTCNVKILFDTFISSDVFVLLLYSIYISTTGDAA